MRSAHAFQIEPRPPENLRHDRRIPAIPEDLGPALSQESAPLHWPVSWPAALYVGDSGKKCTVHVFSATGANLTMHGPPPTGTRVSLKFPFTVYLKGRVAWSRDEVIGIEFDEDTRRSARIVEEVLVAAPVAD